MTLPVPNLDDRRFQQLVDDAKSVIRDHCPDWTDHNVSDPGVTLIETVAHMVDQLLWRLNRVPDRLYVKFLELLGVRLFPPTAARTEVTFRLSAPRHETVHVELGLQVATRRTEREESVAFTVVRPLEIVPCSVAAVASEIEGTEIDQTENFEMRDGFRCFGQPPKVGDALLVGLSNPVPSCAVLLRFDCPVEGVGPDPKSPPLAWEAWTGTGWTSCEVEQEGTGGLNRIGDVVLHVPPGHGLGTRAGRRAAWVRCRVREPEKDEADYSSSPLINGITAATVGGTTEAVNAEIVAEEVMGVSNGVPGQRFQLKRRPVLRSRDPIELVVTTTHRQETWREVGDFAECGERDLRFVLDMVAGEVALGPAVRQEDGSLRQYGAVPPTGAILSIRSYMTGGGRRGNCGPGAISVLKSSIPHVHAVTNRRPASGGVDLEDVENAKLRGPLEVLRIRDRAVTAEDFEYLTKEAAPEVARVRVGSDALRAEISAHSIVRVCVVPSVTGDRLDWRHLAPSSETLERIKQHLAVRRVIGTRVIVEPAEYVWVTVEARLRARERVTAERLTVAALAAIYRYLHPLVGGPEGTGWPFGRPVQVADLYSILQRIPETEFVDEVWLYATDPLGQRGERTERIRIGPDALVFSSEHVVTVTEAP